MTEANLDYVGSITISTDLMQAANLLPYEKVQIANIDNGSRLETYVIPASGPTGEICLNGAAARLVSKGDRVIIISYCMIDEAEMETFKPQVVFVDEANRIAAIKECEPGFTTHLHLLAENS